MFNTDETYGRFLEKRHKNILRREPKLLVSGSPDGVPAAVLTLESPGERGNLDFEAFEKMLFPGLLGS